MFTRRMMLWMVFAPAACAHRAEPNGVLQRAIIAAGGRDALDAAHTLSWQGDAVVHDGERRIEISVDTTITPFVRARSDTWLTAQGRSTLRTMSIENNGGWVDSNDQRRILPPETVANERAQYALYGLMLLTPLLNAPVEEVPPQHDAPPGARYALATRRPQAPPTTLFFDAGYRLVGADNVVPNSEPGQPPIAQRFLFEGVIEANGVRWPRRLFLFQNGSLFFELHLTSFATGDAAAP